MFRVFPHLIIFDRLSHCCPDIQSGFQFRSKAAFRTETFRRPFERASAQHNSRTSGMCDDSAFLPFYIFPGKDVGNSRQFFGMEQSHEARFFTEQSLDSRIGTGNAHRYVKRRHVCGLRTSRFDRREAASPLRIMKKAR